MELSLNSYLNAVVYTLRNPGAAARYLLALDLPARVISLGFLLSVVLTALVAALGWAVLPPLPDTEGAAAAPTLGALTLIFMVIGAVLINNLAIWQAGKILGGMARFWDIMATTTWVSLVMLLLQLVHLLVLLVIPPLSVGTALLNVVAMFVLSLIFVKEAHRFDSLWKAIITVILAVIGLAAGLGLILSLLS